MSATVTITTPEDLLQMPDEGKGYELVNGELKELSVSKESSRIAGQVFLHVSVHCDAKQPAWVFPEGTSFRCFSEDTSRVARPDTSLIALERMPVATYEDEGHCATVPDLVVEVVSPNDNAEDTEEKIEEWLDAGVKVLWEVYPNSRTVRAHRPGNTITLFRSGDILTAPDVLPGFAVPIATLFRRPGEPVTPAATPVT